MHLGWFQIRFADLPEPMWALVVHQPEQDSTLVLLTNIPIPDAAQARLVYDQWRQRPALSIPAGPTRSRAWMWRICGCARLPAMRRLFVLVLLTALFVAYLTATWPQPAVCWLRSLDGKLGLKTDLDGLYLLLAGISFVFTASATLSFAFAHPLPFSSFTYG